MNRLLILVVCVCAIFGCSKKEDSTTSNNTVKPDSNAMAYVITGLTDINIGRTDSTTLALGITLTKGKQEKLTLSTSGLPTGVTGTFANPSGIPSFATTFTLKSNNAAGGTYPFKVIGTSASDSVKTYDLTLKINTPAGCVYELVGNYTSTYTCSSSGTQTSKVDSTGVKDQISITNVPFFPGTILANVNCTNKTLTIPSQVKMQFTISGSGTFTSNSMNIQYTVDYGSGTENCNSTMTK